MSSPFNAPGALIELRELEKTYRSHHEGLTRALERVSFRVDEGEFISIVGPSGCGKSTLLKILAGIIPRTGGQVLLRGSSLESAGANVGLVFQAPVLLPWRTVLENTLLPAVVLGLDLKKAEARARDLLKMVGLEGFEDSYPSELSGGMQQRCAITRGLLHDPPILLMDEPFGALDAMTRENMNLELQRIWMESAKTILLITHSIPEAVFLADRVLVMSARPGRIIDEVRIPFPRPRSLELSSTSQFGEFVMRIRRHFHLSGNVDEAPRQAHG
ncbi:MAG TPA: ABC transporter ATP-binding protein [Burkholderiales bacterium]